MRPVSRASRTRSTAGPTRGGHENQELLAFYRKLCEIRAEEQALADGDLQFSDTTAGALLQS